MPALVSALKSVDLPTLGKPTMPHLRLMASIPCALRVCSSSIARSKSPAAIAGHASSAAVDRGVDRRALVGARRLQHVVDDVLLRNRRVARMADADAQAPEIRRAELRRDVAQAVVAGDAAAELHLRLAGREIELVVDDEDLRRARSRRNAPARRPSGRTGSCTSRASASRRSPAASRDVALELAFARERRAELRRERVDEPEARVVARGVVLAAGIAEADDESDRVCP